MRAQVRTITSCLAGLMLLVTSTIQAQTPANFSAIGNIQTKVPVLQVEVANPTDINVGKTAAFVVVVKNVGDTLAEGVVVRTTLPATVDFERASIKPEAVEEGAVRFYLGDLKANSQKQITLNLLPTKKGPVDLDTRVSFSTSTQSSMRVRESKLKIAIYGPEQAIFGKNVIYKLVVTNKGDGPAENVNIMPNVPESLMADENAGRALTIGTLPAGQSRELTYNVGAIAQGTVDLAFSAIDANGNKSDVKTALQILRPMLKVDIAGPTLRYLNRTGNFEIRVSNPGDAPATNVQVVAAVPPGLRINAIAKAAKYDRDANTLTWMVPSINAGGRVVLPMKATATQIGEQVQTVVAMNKIGLSANAEVTTQVISRPNIWATVVNDEPATEIYQPTTITVLVGNRGSNIAENVAITVDLPEGLEAMPADEIQSEGNKLRFEPITLAIGEQRELTFQALARNAGEHTVRVSFQSEVMSRPLNAEGIAFVYDDKATAEVAERPTPAVPAPTPELGPTPAAAPSTELEPDQGSALAPAQQLELPTPAVGEFSTLDLIPG